VSHQILPIQYYIHTTFHTYNIPHIGILLLVRDSNMTCLSYLTNLLNHNISNSDIPHHRVKITFSHVQTHTRWLLYTCTQFLTSKEISTTVCLTRILLGVILFLVFSWALKENTQLVTMTTIITITVCGNILVCLQTLNQHTTT